MKTPRQAVTKFAGAALAALLLATTALHAGSAPQQVFRPVESRQALSALKPGTPIAQECPKCGAISIFKAAKDHSHAAGFTCPACKLKVSFRDAGGGKARVGYLACVDAKTGKEMSARVCAARE